MAGRKIRRLRPCRVCQVRHLMTADVLATHVASCAGKPAAAPVPIHRFVHDPLTQKSRLRRLAFGAI